MASIVKRNNSYCVVYTYKHTNGTQKQKWETFTDLTDAKNRKKAPGGNLKKIYSKNPSVPLWHPSAEL